MGIPCRISPRPPARPAAPVCSVCFAPPQVCLGLAQDRELLAAQWTLSVGTALLPLDRSLAVLRAAAGPAETATAVAHVAVSAVRAFEFSKQSGDPTVLSRAAAQVPIAHCPPPRCSCPARFDGKAEVERLC